MKQPLIGSQKISLDYYTEDGRSYNLTQAREHRNNLLEKHHQIQQQLKEINNILKQLENASNDRTTSDGKSS